MLQVGVRQTSSAATTAAACLWVWSATARRIVGKGKMNATALLNVRVLLLYTLYSKTLRIWTNMGSWLSSLRKVRINEILVKLSPPSLSQYSKLVLLDYWHTQIRVLYYIKHKNHHCFIILSMKLGLFCVESLTKSITATRVVNKDEGVNSFLSEQLSESSKVQIDKVLLYI